jgi:hypothetical protein
MASAMEREGVFRKPKVGFVGPSNPRFVNMPARVCDVLHQDIEATIAITEKPTY